MTDDRVGRSDVIRSAAPAALFFDLGALGGTAAIANAVANTNPVFFLVGMLVVAFCGYILLVLYRNTYAVIRGIEEPESLTGHAATHRAVAAMRAIRYDRDVAFEDHAVARAYLRKAHRSRLRIALLAALSLAVWVRPLVSI